MSFPLSFSPHIASPALQTIIPGQTKKRTVSSIDQELTEQFASLGLTRDEQAESHKPKEMRLQPVNSLVLSRVKKRIVSDTSLQSSELDALNPSKLARHPIEPAKTLTRKRSLSETDSEPVANGQVVRSRRTSSFKYRSRFGVPDLFWLKIPAILATKTFTNAFAKNMVADVCSKFFKSVGPDLSTRLNRTKLFELSISLYNNASKKIGDSLRDQINLLVVCTFQAADTLQITGQARGDPQRKRLIQLWREQLQANERESVSKTDTNTAIVKSLWQRGKKRSNSAKKTGIIKC